MSEGLIIFLVGLGIGLLNYLLNQLVIKRIDKMEANIEGKDRLNSEAHKELWQEHNETKNMLCERVSKVETKIDIEEQIKRLMSTT